MNIHSIVTIACGACSSCKPKTKPERLKYLKEMSHKSGHLVHAPRDEMMILELWI